MKKRTFAMIKPDAVACLTRTDHYLNRKSRISDHSSKNAPPYDLRHQQILCGTQSASFFQESVSFYDLRSGGRHGT